MGTEETLKGHELFQALTVEEAHKLSEISSVRECAAGLTVFDFNQPGSHIYMVIKGSVELRLPAETGGFGIVVSKIGKGELFGLSPLLDAERYTTAAQCAEPTQILAIEARPLRALLERNSPVAIDVLNRVARVYFSRYLGVLRNLQAVVNQIPLIR